MKRRLVFAIASIFVIMTANVFSQEITVRFIGLLNWHNYCRLDSVVVTNLTRNWSETIEYPDTIIVLGGTVGNNLNIAAEQGLGQNVPNPFDCETRVELSVLQREDVRMQLLDIGGKVYAEYSGMLDAGTHIFDISAANSQPYLLNAIVGSRSYSIRMVNVGSGCGSSIRYVGISDCITAKLTTTNEFHTGDNMRYVGYTTIDGESVASAVVEQRQSTSQNITLRFSSEPTSGTANGHDWVDLGLPSGTLWATCNVGADFPFECGSYFAWGETTAKKIFSWTTYLYCNGSYNTLTKYCTMASYGYEGFTDNLTSLEVSDDAATANWGAEWRMPTAVEMLELFSDCTHEWTTLNGVIGMMFFGRNGNSIFLPATGVYGDDILYELGISGNYWTKSLSAGFSGSSAIMSAGFPDSSIILWFCSDGGRVIDASYRYAGNTVRPIIAR